MVYHVPGKIYELRETDRTSNTSYLLAFNRGNTPLFFETHMYTRDTLTDFAQVQSGTLAELEAELLIMYPSINSHSMQCLATLATGGVLKVILPSDFLTKHYTFERT